MQKFFSLVFSRQALAIAVMIVLTAIVCAVIWFLGPLLALSGLQPLASMMMRAIVIALMCLLLVCLFTPVPMHLFAVAVNCALIWTVGPLLSFAQAKPLASGTVRTVIITVIVTVYLLFLLQRWLRLKQKTSTATAPIAYAELQQIKKTFKVTIRRLKTMRGMNPLRWLVEGKRYLYKQPWYIVIGVPGSGKTHMLVNSGVALPDQLKEVSEYLTTNIPTEHCDVWLPKHAVLIDLAGRYTTQTTDLVKDRTEWLGLLMLLRQKRTLAPINGAIVTIDIAEVIMQTPEQRIAYAAQIRTRLAQLRTELAVTFPTYVTITKMDVLEGFTTYFSALLEDERQQVWGFNLPLKEDEGSRKISLAKQLQTQCHTLLQRLEDDIPQRMLMENVHDIQYDLPLFVREFEAIITPLTQIISAIFKDDLYDGSETRQLHAGLRGVYFTSTAQTTISVPATYLTIYQRHQAIISTRSPIEKTAALRTTLINTEPYQHRSYFVTDVINNIIVPEENLVQANQQEALRIRTLRLVGYAITSLLFTAFVSALVLSAKNNHAYLRAVAEKTSYLNQRVTTLFAASDANRMLAVPDALNAAQKLPLYTNLLLDDPVSNFRYGLYSAPPVANAAHRTYTSLQDSLLLPQIITRMEEVMTTAINNKNAKATYETLRAYLQLHDKNHYNADDLRSWVQNDWASTDSETVFGSRTAMAPHVNALFSNQRVVQSPFLENTVLIEQARDFLGDKPSTERLYIRAKAAMKADAPANFTLIQVVGAQAGTIFRRASGAPLEQGIPGIFTYDGYHTVFDKRLSEFIMQEKLEDAWVMGDQKQISNIVKSAIVKDQITQDIRRQYLEEYTQQWTAFLNDVRTVTGGSLSFDLSVLRTFAAPDSPLIRLARAAARETTLSRSLYAKSDADKNFLDKAADTISKKSQAVIGISTQAKQEKELVDNHFAALREVVTGQPDAALAQSITASASSKPGLDNVTSLLNAYYTLLVMADNALASKTLPPNSSEAGMNLKLEGNKLPAPFNAILTTLADSGTKKISDGTAAILKVQAQQQVDQLNDMRITQVSNACKATIEGAYPFADSAQEVSLADFARVFGAGNAADTFFQKQLASFVDTSRRPWRYKDPSVPNLLSPAEAMAAPAANSTVNTGPTLLSEMLKLLAKEGPNPDRFAQMQAIHDIFFQDPGSKKMAWKVDMKMSELAPTINQLFMNFDGQNEDYAHGPIRSFTINWPGPDGGRSAEIRVTPSISPSTSGIMISSPWALFRLLEHGQIKESGNTGHSSVLFDFDGRMARIDLDTGNLPNPLISRVLKDFACP